MASHIIPGCDACQDLLNERAVATAALCEVAKWEDNDLFLAAERLIQKVKTAEGEHAVLDHGCLIP